MTSLSCRRVSRARLCLTRARPNTNKHRHQISHSTLTPRRCGSVGEEESNNAPAVLDIQAAQVVSLAAAGLVVFAGAAQAGEAVPTELAGLLDSWLDAIQALGPLGPAAFVVTIGICECIPFFPTQPLSICAGLLFGGGTGAALNLLGLSIASTLAFTLSRTVGRGLAQAVIDAETGGKEGQSGGQGTQNAVAAQIEKAQAAIENGGPLQQFTAILLLRLTPVVPFSASNYVLGLTPVAYGPFIGATVAGMSVWAVLLASLGGAGRGLLASGEDVSDAIAQVSSGAGEMTGTVVACAVVLAIGALGLNAVAPTILPDPENLGKPEAQAEAKRLAGLRSAAMVRAQEPGDEGEDAIEHEAVLASASRVQKE